MAQARGRSYRIREFAKLAGVTVRALQHYDRMGLLTPSRSQAGSRVYSQADLQALVQIVALKSVGVPLKKIGMLRANGPSALFETLGSQRRAMERRQPVLDRVIFAVRNIEAVLESGEEADPAVLRPLMEALRTGESDVQAPPQAARPAPAWEELKQEWETLLADLEAGSADPGDSTMQALAARWERLMALSTDGVSYAHDLAQCVDSLRSGGQSRGVPGAVPFERIGLALACRVARNGSGRPFQR
jgi:MerR family transcriptional regulator, thiopeptide resistance regulator